MLYYCAPQNNIGVTSGGPDNTALSGSLWAEVAPALEISPNPAGETALLRLWGVSGQEARLQLFDQLGGPVRLGKWYVAYDGQEHELDLSGLPTGGYVLQLITEEEVLVKRLAIISGK